MALPVLRQVAVAAARQSCSTAELGLLGACRSLLRQSRRVVPEQCPAPVIVWASERKHRMAWAPSQDRVRSVARGRIIDMVLVPWSVRLSFSAAAHCRQPV
jgi:hypothetical protein